MESRSASRRLFLGALLCSPLVLAPDARAQRPEKAPRIGVLANHVPRKDLELGAASPFHGAAAFVEALRKAGWHDGRNIQILWRSAEGRMERHPKLAADLVRTPVDVIVGGDDAVDAAARATTVVPIVAYGMYNPVEAGYAASLARPGRNITGIANSAGAEIQKSLLFLKEASPRITRVALVAQAHDIRADNFGVLRPDSMLCGVPSASSRGGRSLSTMSAA